MAVDRQLPEDQAACRGSAAGPMVDARGGGSADCGLFSSHGGDCSVCAGYGVQGFGDNRLGSGAAWNSGERKTAWLNRTGRWTPRGVPLNRDAVAILASVRGQHSQYCFTYNG